MQSLISRAKWLLIASAILAIMAMVMTPSPFATLENFASARGTIAETRIVPYIGNRYSHFDLQIIFTSGEIYYLREPEREPIERYLASVPAQGPITIHFRDDSTGHRIYDVRNGDHVFISFAEIIAEYTHKRNILLAVAGAFASLGLVGLVWGHRLKKRSQMKKGRIIHAPRKPALIPNPANGKEVVVRG